MTLSLFAATSNPGKLRDFEIAAGAGVAAKFEVEVSIVPLPRLEAISVPEEDQATFEGNARLKAIYYSRFAPGEIVLADDSGLEVDALDGAPGVRSARYAEDMNYAGEGPTDERNNSCLVAALKDVPASGRSARYRCVLVAVRDGEMMAMGAGAVEGQIVAEPRGSGGFGYDPYFVAEGMSETMAELAPEERLELSHRGRALRDLLGKMLVTQLR